LSGFSALGAGCDAADGGETAGQKLGVHSEDKTPKTAQNEMT